MNTHLHTNFYISLKLLVHTIYYFWLLTTILLTLLNYTPIYKYPHYFLEVSLQIFLLS